MVIGKRSGRHRPRFSTGCTAAPAERVWRPHRRVPVAGGVDCHAIPRAPGDRPPPPTIALPCATLCVMSATAVVEPADPWRCPRERCADSHRSPSDSCTRLAARCRPGVALDWAAGEPDHRRHRRVDARCACQHRERRQRRRSMHTAPGRRRLHGSVRVVIDGACMTVDAVYRHATRRARGLPLDGGDST